MRQGYHYAWHGRGIAAPKIQTQSECPLLKTVSIKNSAEVYLYHSGIPDSLTDCIKKTYIR